MSPQLRQLFKWLNRYWMVPLFRLGVGAWLVNPLVGYIAVLKTIGRRSGRVRHAPVNYMIHGGAVYFVSGGRERSDWYRNLLAQPEIDVLLPSGAVRGKAEVVTDPDERLYAARKVLQSAGFAGFFEGYNPHTIDDTALREKIADLPVLRLRVPGLAGGADDPGGWGWVVRNVSGFGLYLALRRRR